MSPQGLRQRPRKKRDRLARTRARPRPEQWGDDEAMTLIEAVTVFFPTGPLTLSSLRTEARERRLAVARVAGKVLTTPRAIKQLVTPCLAAKQSRRVSTSEENGTAQAPGSSSTAAGKSAQAATRKRLKELRTHSKITSPSDTSRPSAPVILLSSRSATS
jgi:hypothetical protein